MNIDTEVVHTKRFSTAISSELLKHSQEYRVLATLRYLFPGKYDDMIVDDCPDLQDRVSGLGIEVTSVVKNADMKSSRLFSFYCVDTDEERKKETLRKLNADGYSIVDSVAGKALVCPVGTSEGEKNRFQKCILHKQDKIKEYKAKFDRVALAILLHDIPSSEAERHCVDWIREFQSENTQDYDTIIILSHRFCIVYNKRSDDSLKFSLTNDVTILLHTIARMTAEGELSLSSPEWT